MADAKASKSPIQPPSQRTARVDGAWPNYFFGARFLTAGFGQPSAGRGFLRAAATSSSHLGRFDNNTRGFGPLFCLITPLLLAIAVQHVVQQWLKTRGGPRCWTSRNLTPTQSV